MFSMFGKKWASIVLLLSELKVKVRKLCFCSCLTLKQYSSFFENVFLFFWQTVLSKIEVFETEKYVAYWFESSMQHIFLYQKLIIFSSTVQFAKKNHILKKLGKSNGLEWQNCISTDWRTDWLRLSCVVHEMQGKHATSLY